VSKNCAKFASSCDRWSSQLTDKDRVVSDECGAPCLPPGSIFEVLLMNLLDQCMRGNQSRPESESDSRTEEK